LARADAQACWRRYALKRMIFQAETASGQSGVVFDGLAKIPVDVN
jgi:hypothetical protein